MIPKTIHYCWFGKAKKNKEILKCLESWNKLLPDYKIIEWNEDNYQSSSFFFQQCFKKKRWAFASDYARIDLLYRFGGIYLDTDMLLLKKLDSLLQDNLFFGLESDLYLSCGIIGAKKENNFIGKILLEFNKVKEDSYFINYTIVKKVTELFLKLGIVIKAGVTEDLAIYPVDFFYPFPYGAQESPYDYIKDETIAIHLWNASWYNNYSKANLAIGKKKIMKAWGYYIKSLFDNPKHIKYFFNMVKNSFIFCKLN